jgi:Arc/MetJ-type ribon-helix-helix transcriptional regulator
MGEHLSPANEEFLDRAVARGVYRDRGEALDQAVDLLRRREELSQKLQEGVDALDRGDHDEYGDSPDERKRFVDDVRRGSEEVRLRKSRG